MATTPQGIVTPGSVPLWAGLPRLPELLGPRRLVVWQGYLRDLYPEAEGLDLRGLLSWPEARMVEESEWVAGWVADMLGLRECEDWRGRLAPLLDRVTRQFFGHRPDFPGFVFVESCRDRVPLQRPGLAQRGFGEPRPRPAPAGRRSYELYRGFRLPAYLLEFADLHAPGARPGRVVDFGFTREFAAGGVVLSGRFNCLCAGDPADDRADLRDGRIPAGRLCDIGRRLNTGRLACWVRLTDPSGGWVETLTLDIHPGTGGVLSVRHNLIESLMLCEMHPRWHGWLREAYEGGT